MFVVMYVCICESVWPFTCVKETLKCTSAAEIISYAFCKCVCGVSAFYGEIFDKALIYAPVSCQMWACQFAECIYNGLSALKWQIKAKFLRASGSLALERAL